MRAAGHRVRVVNHGGIRVFRRDDARVMPTLANVAVIAVAVNHRGTRLLMHRRRGRGTTSGPAYPPVVHTRRGRRP
jgi:hypothetical protein